MAFYELVWLRLQSANEWNEAQNRRQINLLVLFVNLTFNPGEEERKQVLHDFCTGIELLGNNGNKSDGSTCFKKRAHYINYDRNLTTFLGVIIGKDFPRKYRQRAIIYRGFWKNKREVNETWVWMAGGTRLIWFWSKRTCGGFEKHQSVCSPINHQCLPFRINLTKAYFS